MEADVPNIFRGIDTPGHVRGMRIKRVQEASKVPFGVGLAHSYRDDIKRSIYQQDYPRHSLTIRPDSDMKRNNPHPSQRFMNWRVPRHLINERVVRLSSVMKDTKLEHSTDRKQERTVIDTEALSQLSKMKFRPPYVFGPTPSPTESSSSTSSGSVEVSTRRKQAKSQQCQRKREGSNVFLPAVLPAVNKWMEVADKNEKQVVSDIITAADQSGMKTDAADVFYPCALPGVEKWLKKADEKDRKVAAKFFTTLSRNNKLPNQTDSEREMRMRNAMRLKRKRQPVFGANPPLSMSHLLTKSRHLAEFGQQLLDHGPEPVAVPPNRTAMFVQPQVIAQRHFSIHPEWGLS